MSTCRFCHGSKKMRELIGFNGKEQIYRWVRCLCDTEIRRLKAKARKNVEEAGGVPSALPPPDKRSVMLHNQEGVTIRVEPREVAEWQVEGFRQYRQQPRGRPKPRKKLAAIRRRGR